MHSSLASLYNGNRKNFLSAENLRGLPFLWGMLTGTQNHPGQMINANLIFEIWIAIHLARTFWLKRRNVRPIYAVYLIFFLFTWISIRYYWMMFESAKVTHIFSKEANRRTVRHSKTGSVVDCFPLYLPSLLGKMHIYFIASNLNGQPKDLQERKCRTISSFSILEFQTI